MTAQERRVRLAAMRMFVASLENDQTMLAYAFNAIEDEDLPELFNCLLGLATALGEQPAHTVDELIGWAQDCILKLEPIA